MKATVDLSPKDFALIIELGENAQTFQEFIVTAADVMGKNAEDQDAITYMGQQIMKGILLLQKLRPA